jgi:hypothetical protein
MPQRLSTYKDHDASALDHNIQLDIRTQQQSAKR